MCAEWSYHGRISRSHDAVALHLVAELPLDRRIDQDAIHLGQAGGQMQQRDLVRRPARRIDAALVRTHHARQFHRLALRRGQRAFRRHIEADIDIETELMAEMPARQRSAARPRDVLDVEIAQPRRVHLLAQGLDRARWSKARPRRNCATGGWSGTPVPSAGSRTAPAMQPAAWPPMMCSGPGAGVSRPAATRQHGRQHDANPPSAEAGLRTGARTP